MKKGTGSMEKQCLSGLHQDPIGNVGFSFSEVSVMALAQCRQLCRRQQALIPSLTGRLFMCFVVVVVVAVGVVFLFFLP